MVGRRTGLRALCSLAFIGAATLGWLGCQASKSTELIAGISTQVQVPRDIKTIQIRVSVSGAQIFCQNYAAYDGHVQLPRTLGTLPRQDSTAVVTITILGYQAADSDVQGNAGIIASGTGFQCNSDTAIVGGDINQIQNGNVSGGARILRRSKQPYSAQEILFIPMPLKYSCFDVDCSPQGTDKTCKAGKCVDSIITTDKLAPYNDNLIYGGDTTCFQLDNGEGGGCFNDTYTIPPVTVDDDKCVYRVPNASDLAMLGISPPSLPGGITLPADALNVRVVYDGGVTKEILDLDADEGFSVPDATNPQTFQLAPGLCDLVHGYGGAQHRVTGIEINPVCRPKLPSQSICAKDQIAIVGGNPDTGEVANPDATCVTTPLQPQKAVLEFVVDPTQSAADFYGAVGTFGQKLIDPALSNLSVGVHFMPSGNLSGQTCPTKISSLPSTAAPLPAVDPMNPNDPTKSPLYKYLAGLVGGDLTKPTAPTLAPLTDRLNVVAGLEAAYADLANTKGATQSIIVVGHNSMTTGATPDLSLSCLDTAVTPNKSQTPAQVITAHNGAEVTVLEIGSPLLQNDPCAGALGTAVGRDLLGNPRCQPTEGSSGHSQIQAQIANAIIESVACVYKAPTDKPDEIWFNDIVMGKIVVQPSTDATSIDACRTGGSGFYSDGTTLMLCGSSCGQYLTALQEATAVANAAAATGGSSSGSFKLPTIIPLFAMKGTACAPPSSGNPMMSGGGTFQCATTTCTTGQVCCRDSSGNGSCLPSGSSCPVTTGMDAGGNPTPDGGAGLDSGTGSNCNPGNCASGCCDPKLGCRQLSDSTCGKNGSSCNNCLSSGLVCDQTTAICTQCNASTGITDGTNCSGQEQCTQGLGGKFSFNCTDNVGMGTSACTCLQNGGFVKNVNPGALQCQTAKSAQQVKNFLLTQCGAGG